MILNKKNILIVMLLFFLLIETNFFKNAYQIISMSHNERLVEKYGFCSNEGVGYIEYIKNEIATTDKIKVINFNNGPPLDWKVYNTNTKKTDFFNNFILINYPGDNHFKKIDYINNKLIINAEYGLRYIKAINYILISNIDIKDNNNFLEITLKDNQKIIYQKRFDNIESNNIIFETDYKVDSNKNNLADLKLKLEVNYKNLKINKNYDISANMMNQIDLNEFTIINKVENCYFITEK